MYEIKIGLNLIVYANTTAEAFTVAISAYHQGAEVTVMNTITGELVLSLMDEGYGGVYVASAIVYGV